MLLGCVLRVVQLLVKTATLMDQGREGPQAIHCHFGLSTAGLIQAALHQVRDAA